MFPRPVIIRRPGFSEAIVMSGIRPFPLPGDVEVPSDVRVARPAIYVHRAASAHLRAYVSGGMSPLDAAQKMFNGDAVTDLILRAASGPADTQSTGWAKQLAGVAIFDLIQSITSLSAAAEVISRALKLNMDGVAELHIPRRTVDPTTAAAWVAEGQNIPVRALSFSGGAILTPKKLAVINGYSEEMAASSNLEPTIRQTLGEALALGLDLQMFSADPGDASKPPGLFAGTAPLTPTAGGGDNAMHGDIANLFGALASAGGGKTAIIVASLPQATRLKMAVGPKFDIDIISSTALPSGVVAVVEAASLVSGFGSTPEFVTSKHAAVHFEGSTPADFPAVPIKSLFQIRSVALRTNLWAAWGLRAAGHAQWIQSASW
jgi:Phage capsid family